MENRLRLRRVKEGAEKEMATHFSVLAWEIPRTEEPGGLQSMGSQRVGRDLVSKQGEPRRRRILDLDAVNSSAAESMRQTLQDRQGKKTNHSWNWRLPQHSLDN